MNRGELAVTVLGLLGTFLLPWPGEWSSAEVRAMAPDAAAGPALCRPDARDDRGLPAAFRASGAAALPVGRS